MKQRVISTINLRNIGLTQTFKNTKWKNKNYNELLHNRPRLFSQSLVRLTEKAPTVPYELLRPRPTCIILLINTRFCDISYCRELIFNWLEANDGLPGVVFNARE